MASEDHRSIQFNADGVLRLGFGEYGRELEVAAISTDGTTALTVHEVGVAEIFDIKSSKKIATIKPTSPLTGSKAGPTSLPFKVFIEAADFCPGTNTVALGLNDGSCHLYEINTGELISRIKEPYGLLPRAERNQRAACRPEDDWELVRCLRFSPDGTRLAIGHFGATVSVWNNTGTEVIGYFRPDESMARTGSSIPRPGMVSSVGFSADSRYVFAGTSDQLCFAWDCETKNCVFSATEHTAETLAIHQSSDTVRWATSRGQVWACKAESDVELHSEFGSHWTSVEFSPCGQSLLAFCRDNHIELVDLNNSTKTTLSKVPGSWRDGLKPFAFGNSNKEFMHLDSETSFILHRNGESMHCEIESEFSQFLLSPDRCLIGVKSWADSVKLWSFANGKRVGEYPSGAGTGSFAISPDNRLLVVGELGNGGGSYDRHASVFDIESRECLQNFVADQFQIRGVGFGKSSARFITKSSSLSIWDWTGSQVKLVNQISIDNHSNNFHVLNDGRILVFMFTETILLNESGLIINRFAHRRRYRELIEFDEPAERFYCSESFQAITEWNFGTGEQVATYARSIPIPNVIPSPEIAMQHQVARAYNWATKFGNFLHLGDGPRGWVTPLRLSDDGQLIVLPGKTQAILLRVSNQNIVAQCEFRGRLRASFCNDKEMILINSDGEIFGNLIAPAQS